MNGIINGIKKLNRESSLSSMVRSRPSSTSTENSEQKHKRERERIQTTQVLKDSLALATIFTCTVVHCTFYSILSTYFCGFVVGLPCKRIIFSLYFRRSDAAIDPLLFLPIKKHLSQFLSDRE